MDSFSDTASEQGDSLSFMESVAAAEEIVENFNLKDFDESTRADQNKFLYPAKFLATVFNIKIEGKSLENIQEEIVGAASERNKISPANPNYIPGQPPEFLIKRMGYGKIEEGKKLVGLSNLKVDKKVDKTALPEGRSTVVALCRDGTLIPPKKDIEESNKSQEAEEPPNLPANHLDQYRVHIYNGKFLTFDSELQSSDCNYRTPQCYTLTSNGELFVYPKDLDKKTMLSFSSSLPVLSAGEISIENGQLKTLSTLHPCYDATFLSAYHALGYFEERETDLSKVQVLTTDDPSFYLITKEDALSEDEHRSLSTSEGVGDDEISRSSAVIDPPQTANQDTESISLHSIPDTNKIYTISAVHLRDSEFMHFYKNLQDIKQELGEYTSSILTTFYQIFFPKTIKARQNIAFGIVDLIDEKEKQLKMCTTKEDLQRVMSSFQDALEDYKSNNQGIKVGGRLDKKINHFKKEFKEDVLIQFLHAMEHLKNRLSNYQNSLLTSFYKFFFPQASEKVEHEFNFINAEIADRMSIVRQKIMSIADAIKKSTGTSSIGEISDQIDQLNKFINDKYNKLPSGRRSKEMLNFKQQLNELKSSLEPKQEEQEKKDQELVETLKYMK